MSLKKISNSVSQISLGPVNCFLIEDDGFTLIDTGFKGDEAKIFKAMEKAGMRPRDIKQIILTHSHPDHAGSASAIKQKLNIPVNAHPEDASLIRRGVAGRLPFVVSPGLKNMILFNLFIKRSPNKVEAIQEIKEINDGDMLPIKKGLRVIHIPGHSLGQVALLLEEEGVMFCADLCSNMGGLGYSTVYEDREAGRESIRKVLNYDFNIASFGHGNPISKNPKQRFEDTFKLNS